MILTVTLNPAVDRTVRVESFRVNAVQKTAGSTATAGGKGVNVARVLKTLGARAEATGILGGAAGAFFRSCLKEEGIDGEFMDIGGETRQNTTIIDTAEKTETHLLEEGPRVAADETEKFLEVFRRIVDERRPECAVLSGSLPPGMPEDIYARMIEIAREKQLKTALDAGGAPLRQGAAAGCFFLKPNASELRELAGRELRSKDEMLEFIFSLRVPEVLATMGGDGAVLAAGENAWEAVPPAITAVNSVGAGDAFLAGYLYARMLEDAPVPEAARLGAACAASNCLSGTAGAVAADDINRLKPLVTVRRLR